MTPPAALGTLGDLLARRGVARGAPDAEPAPARSGRSSDPDIPDLAGCGKVTLRRERKGHGGKTATVVSGLGLDARRLDRVARALRRALGTGAGVVGDRVVVQGDLVPRVRALLAARGARRIVVGN